MYQTEEGNRIHGTIRYIRLVVDAQFPITAAKHREQCQCYLVVCSSESRQVCRLSVVSAAPAKATYYDLLIL